MARDQPVRVDATSDPVVALATCGGLLERDAVAHNVALTVLHDRIAHPRPGRYWWATDHGRGSDDGEDGDVVGYAWQSPDTISAGIVPASTGVARALAERMFADAPTMPGVIGDAATSAAFTGRWTELTGRGARPHEGERLYRLDRVEDLAAAPGRCGRATRAELDTVVRWLIDFDVETGATPPPDVSEMVSQAVDEARLWLWFDDGAPVALVRLTGPVGGVVRIGPVYTPPERRGRGYATSLVAEVSRSALAGGARACMLYTQLANATSNAIYRRIGYRSVGEVTAYHFDPPR